MDLTGRAAVVGAALTTGLMAGVYLAFTISVMPGLARSSDRTLTEAMQQINVAILNGWFAVVFAGPLILGLLTLATHLAPGTRAARPGVLPWVVGGLLLYAASLVVTFAVNVPLNDALAAVDLPSASPAALAAAREAFEARWTAANLARTLAAVASSATYLIALLVRQ